MASKESHGLGTDCFAVRRTNKGKSVLLSFKEGLAPHVDDPFSNKYSMLELESGRKEILFRLDWNSNMNDRSIDPRV